MPHERTGRTYFSEFTAPSATLSVGKIQRAKSNEHLSRFCKSKQSKSSLLSPGSFHLQLPKARSTQDLSRKNDRKSVKSAASQVNLATEEPDASYRLEFEQELEEELQKLVKRSRYCKVSVPSSVKFSVTGDVPNKQPQLSFTSPSHSSSAMSRPRSPKSKEPQQLEGLEKLLYNIRQQLNQLSDERAQMEQRMDDVINGIQQAQTQYHNQLRNYYQGRNRGQKHSPPTPNSLRRVHSSGEKYTNSAWLIPQTSDTSLDVPDGPPSNQKEPVTTFNESSQCSQEEYNMKEPTADSAYGGSCSRGPRSDSFSSIESRSRSSSLNIGGSLSQSNDVFGNWMSNSTIPEVPESPRPSATSQPCSTSLSQDSYMHSMPSLSYHSYTTPNRHGRPASPLSMSIRQHRSYSTSTPKHNEVKVPSSPKMMRLKPSFKATSSPDVSRKGVPSRPEQHQLKTHRSFHSSLTDSVMNSVIAEDKVDSQSFTDSLSQISTCTDDGSPKASGSTIIVRRSSLTGQLEHIRKPRAVATVKRNSSFDIAKDYSTQARPRASSVCGVNNQTLPKEFKVLNRGIRKSRKRISRPIILNTSVETTV